MLGETGPDLEIRLASIDDPKLLDEVFAGVVAVINCAGHPVCVCSATAMCATSLSRVMRSSITT